MRAVVIAIVGLLAFQPGPGVAATMGPAQLLLESQTNEIHLWAAGDAAGNGLVVVREGPQWIGLPTPFLLLERAAGGPWSAFSALPGGGQRSGISVAAAGDGAAAIVWRRHGGRRLGAIEALVRQPGGRFGTPVAVAGAQLGGVGEPVVGVDAAGGAVVAFLARTEGRSDPRSARVAVAVLRVGDRRFRRPVFVSRASGRPPPGRPVLAMSDDGHAVVTWRRAGRIEAVSVDHGRIGRARSVARTTPFASAPSVALAPGGDAIVAWTTNAEARGRVLATIRRPPLPFAPARIVSRTIASQLEPLALDDGRFLIGWFGLGPRGTVDGSARSSIRIAVAGSRASRFAAPAAVVRDAGASSRALLARAPSGFTLLWPAFHSPTDAGWRLAFGSHRAAVGDHARLPGEFSTGHDLVYASAATLGAGSGRIAVLYTLPFTGQSRPGVARCRLLVVDFAP